MNITVSIPQAAIDIRQLKDKNGQPFGHRPFLSPVRAVFEEDRVKTDVLYAFLGARVCTGRPIGKNKGPLWDVRILGTVPKRIKGFFESDYKWTQLGACLGKNGEQDRLVGWVNTEEDIHGHPKHLLYNHIQNVEFLQDDEVPPEYFDAIRPFKELLSAGEGAALHYPVSLLGAWDSALEGVTQKQGAFVRGVDLMGLNDEEHPLKMKLVPRVALAPYHPESVRGGRNDCVIRLGEDAALPVGIIPRATPSQLSLR